MNARDEIDRLARAVVEGEPLSETDQLHLAALLRDDPDAQGRYLDHLFLDDALRWEKPTAPPRAAPRRLAPPRTAVALAACLLLAAGLWLAGPAAPRSDASADLVDRLADWNLAIAAAPTPDDRRTSYAERADSFRAELARAPLPPDDRELAAALLDGARALSEQSNPLDQAEQLDRLAERMHQWMGDRPQADRRARAVDGHYLRFVERSQANLRRAAPPTDKARHEQMKRLHDRIGHRADARFRRDSERFHPKKKKR